MAAREVELKLHVHPRDLARVAGLPVLVRVADGPPVTVRLRTTYYDTPDLRLAAAGVALRVRAVGDGPSGGYVQAVKTMAGDQPGDSAGVAVRREWEWPIAGPGPDLARLDAQGVGSVVPDDARSALVPVFTTDFQRTLLLVRPDERSLIEVVVDDGAITAGTGQAPISEVELELKSGKVGQLFELALALHRHIPMRLATDNKAEVGYRLVTGHRPSGSPAEPLGLSPMTTVAEAFRHIVRNGLRHLLANEACALGGGDAEGLHQVRVATRRLRFALGLFADRLAGEDAAHLRRELRWLVERLSIARDWDVTQTVLRAVVGDGGPLPAAVAAARTDAAEDAAAALSGARASRLLLTLGEWLENGRWQPADEDGRAALEAPVAGWAVAWLAELHGKARKAGRDLDEAGEDKLRRRLRKLGHAAAFCRGVFPAAPTRAYLAALEGVLALLDDLHDVSTTRRRLARLEPSREALVEAEERLSGFAAERRALLPERWAAFRAVPVFWE